MDFTPNKGQYALSKRLQAWWNTKYQPVFVYSGGPGTGKTTILKFCIDSFGLKCNEYITLAYSGKAVNVLAGHGLPAMTIHSFAYNVELLRLKDDMGEYILKPDGSYKYSLEFVLKKDIDPNIKLIVIDELSMVPDSIMFDLVSLGIPIIGMGDIFQLPPVFGTCSFILRPNFFLTEIMRQEADSPIIQLCEMVKRGEQLKIGSYGNCRVLEKFDLDDRLITDYEMLLCCRNATRDDINDFIRMKLYGRREYPTISDKILCRQNVKDRTAGGRFLTNGTLGWIDDILPGSRTGKKMDIDFIPDYDTNALFTNLSLDTRYITSAYETRKEYGLTSNIKFEYGNIITAHLSQGSEYSKILYFNEPFGNYEMQRKIQYTAISRASESIDIVMCNRY